MTLPDSSNTASSQTETGTVTKILGLAALTVVMTGVLIVAWYGRKFIVTPPSLRKPIGAHYHFRLQIINEGQPINFANDNFQTPYDKFSCSVALPEEPIHFHDAVDQIVHIHWQGITGGILLKQYGWNYLGGNDAILGYRFDGGWKPKPIKIKGNILPAITNEVNYYLYTGDQNYHELKNWSDFLVQDLEVFFKNSLSTNSTENAATPTNTTNHNSETDHTAIHQVVGNAVLFVQKEQPTEEQVQKYFNNLVPLPESTCGG